jgi:hypothetical protein
LRPDASLDSADPNKFSVRVSNFFHFFFIALGTWYSWIPITFNEHFGRDFCFRCCSGRSSGSAYSLGGSTGGTQTRTATRERSRHSKGSRNGRQSQVNGSGGNTGASTPHNNNAAGETTVSSAAGTARGGGVTPGSGVQGNSHLGIMTADDLPGMNRVGSSEPGSGPSSPLPSNSNRRDSRSGFSRMLAQGGTANSSGYNSNASKFDKFGSPTLQASDGSDPAGISPTADVSVHRMGSLGGTLGSVAFSASPASGRKSAGSAGADRVTMGGDGNADDLGTINERDAHEISTSPSGGVPPLTNTVITIHSEFGHTSPVHAALHLPLALGESPRKTAAALAKEAALASSSSNGNPPGGLAMNSSPRGILRNGSNRPDRMQNLPLSGLMEQMPGLDRRRSGLALSSGRTSATNGTSPREQQNQQQPRSARRARAEAAAAAKNNNSDNSDGVLRTPSLTSERRLTGGGSSTTANSKANSERRLTGQGSLSSKGDRSERRLTNHSDRTLSTQGSISSKSERRLTNQGSISSKSSDANSVPTSARLTNQGSLSEKRAAMVAAANAQISSINAAEGVSRAERRATLDRRQTLDRRLTLNERRATLERRSTLTLMLTAASNNSNNNSLPPPFERRGSTGMTAAAAAAAATSLSSRMSLSPGGLIGLNISARPTSPMAAAGGAIMANSNSYDLPPQPVINSSGVVVPSALATSDPARRNSRRLSRQRIAGPPAVRERRATLERSILNDPPIRRLSARAPFDATQQQNGGGAPIPQRSGLAAAGQASLNITPSLPLTIGAPSNNPSSPLPSSSTPLLSSTAGSTSPGVPVLALPVASPSYQRRNISGGNIPDTTSSRSPNGPPTATTPVGSRTPHSDNGSATPPAHHTTNSMGGNPTPSGSPPSVVAIRHLAPQSSPSGHELTVPGPSPRTLAREHNNGNTDSGYVAVTVDLSPRVLAVSSDTEPLLSPANNNATTPTTSNRSS